MTSFSIHREIKASVGNFNSYVIALSSEVALEIMCTLAAEASPFTGLQVEA